MKTKQKKNIGLKFILKIFQKIRKYSYSLFHSCPICARNLKHIWPSNYTTFNQDDSLCPNLNWTIAHLTKTTKSTNIFIQRINPAYEKNQKIWTLFNVASKLRIFKTQLKMLFIHHPTRSPCVPKDGKWASHTPASHFSSAPSTLANHYKQYYG